MPTPYPMMRPHVAHVNPMRPHANANPMRPHANPMRPHANPMRPHSSGFSAGAPARAPTHRVDTGGRGNREPRSQLQVSCTSAGQLVAASTYPNQPKLPAPSRSCLQNCTVCTHTALLSASTPRFGTGSFRSVTKKQRRFIRPTLLRPRIRRPTPGMQAHHR
jgi:hypothetical protein